MAGRRSRARRNLLIFWLVVIGLPVVVALTWGWVSSVLWPPMFG